MNRDPFDDAEVTAIAEEIERYIEDHPRSKDSLVGIRSWWLTEETMSTAPGKAQEAVDRLVDNGVLCRKMLPDGTIIYARRAP